MTREEAIIEAGIEYSIQNSPYCIGGDNFYEKARELNRNKSFEAGVIWADKNPKSPWISVDEDLPNNPKYLKQPDYSSWVIALTENGEVIPAQMIVMHGKWIWHSRFSGKHEDIIYWMFRPKFPPEFV